MPCKWVCECGVSLVRQSNAARHRQGKHHKKWLSSTDTPTNRIDQSAESNCLATLLLEEIRGALDNQGRRAKRHKSGSRLNPIMVQESGPDDITVQPVCDPITHRAARSATVAAAAAATHTRTASWRQSAGLELAVQSVAHAPIDVCMRRVRAFFACGGMDCKLDRVQVSVICPIAQAPIVIPARGVHCSHLQCFDLAAFAKTLRGRQTVSMKCPLCSRQLRLTTIIIDDLMARIVDECAEVHKKVDMLMTGTWQPIVLPLPDDVIAVE
eukprot:NODE_1454_length_905_cov_411.649533_g1124_i0.p1 GENE.NODE_1454_length_905_cov_411.649533_g1124_i0~~NODE_1454_length_905_cov_411.649533_g1124_i0.p1  ORF type:complete len:287 (-),score=74.23 NODE_1454_length_905_cov_411.649533_g1124_i0:44-850(-)